MQECGIQGPAGTQPDQIYDMMDKELPKTSLPHPEDIHAAYEKLIQEGYTDVVQICISAAMSGTWNMIRILARRYQARMNIRVVDTKTLSTGLGAMVLAAAKALEAGADPDAAIQTALKVRGSQLGDVCDTDA